MFDLKARYAWFAEDGYLHTLQPYDLQTLIGFLAYMFNRRDRRGK